MTPEALALIHIDHTFIQNFTFSSPSTAACMVLGRSANGRLEWKDGQGRALKALQEDGKL